MPRLSEFYGIVVWMYFADHDPPHFHATYGEHSAVVELATSDVLRGSLPSRQLRLVREWAALHHDELLANWHRAQAGDPLAAIAPLA